MLSNKDDTPTVVNDAPDDSTLTDRVKVDAPPVKGLTYSMSAQEYVAWGKPTKYAYQHCLDLITYFIERSERTRIVTTTQHTKDGHAYETESEEANPPPTMYGFAAQIQVNQDTLTNWAKKHPEFKKAVDIAKGIQADFILSNGMVGKAPASMAALMMKNVHGWKDKSEQEITHRTSLENLVGDTFKDDGK
jgi:hypothetical protein